MTIIVPNLNRPLVNKDGLVTKQSEWVAFFSQFVTAPNVVVDIAGVSPLSYIVKEPGSVYVNGGTVSSIIFSRGTTNLDVTGQKLIPVEIKDIVTVTFTVAPTIQFVPRY